MLTADEIATMTPEQAKQEIIEVTARLPLLLLIAMGKPSEADQQLLSAQEVARRLGVSGSFVRMKAASDPGWASFAKKVGGRWRFRRLQFERIVAEGKSRELL